MSTHKITPEPITELKPNQVFVYPCTTTGIHGSGTAKDALKWGAVYGSGSGRHGQTYAIPTKNSRLRPLPSDIIAEYVNGFTDHARCNPRLEFLVVGISTGSTKSDVEDIAPMFKYAPDNVALPESFVRVLALEALNCEKYVEDPAICYTHGDAKGQCANCGYLWYEHLLKCLPEDERESAKRIQDENFN